MMFVKEAIKAGGDSTNTVVCVLQPFESVMVTV
jgi:hypothetical protein